MSRLVLGDELARVFLGALLTVARADGEVNPEESRILRQVAAEIGSAVDFAELLFDSVTPKGLADAIRAADAAPFRGLSISPMSVIASAFADAAQRVADADGDVNPRESAAIAKFNAALST